MKQTQTLYPYEHKFRHIIPILIRYRLHPLLLLWCQCKSIISRFCFKPIEFDRFKIGIVNLFPQAQKWNRRMIAHPVCHHDKSIVWIFIFCNISERNVSIFINNIAHHSDFCSIGIYFHVFQSCFSPFLHYGHSLSK